MNCNSIQGDRGIHSNQQSRNILENSYLMTRLPQIVVIASGLFMVGLAILIFIKPAVTERFILSFASSARAHYIEMCFRLLLGASLVLLSHEVWQPKLFLALGWIIVITSVALLLMPWQLHQRLGRRVLPILVRNMKPYGLGVFAFGALLLYGAMPAFMH